MTVGEGKEAAEPQEQFILMLANEDEAFDVHNEGQ